MSVVTSIVDRIGWPVAVATAIGIPVSVLAGFQGYRLIHSGIFALVLISPGYFALEQQGQIPSPTVAAWAAYLVAQWFCFFLLAILVAMVVRYLRSER